MVSTKQYQVARRWLLATNNFHTIGVWMIAFLLIAGFLLSLPSTLFPDPYSTVLYDRNGSLLNASIASDGQWRFPGNGHIPDKFGQAITMFEDKRFYVHPGV